MSAPAWMPFYVADYLADTGHLSTLEHGAYMLLIMHYWQNGGLPTEDRKLARIARLTDDDWQDAKVTLAELFDDDWKHGRIDHELRTACETMEKRSAAGKRAASARYAKRNRGADQTHAPKGVGKGTHLDISEAIPEEASPRASGSEPSWRQEFDMVFWPDWPHKVGRKRAIAAYIAARASHPLEVIIAGRDRYFREKPPDRDWLNPATFLEDERFLDEPAEQPPRQSNAASKPHDTVLTALATVVERRDRERQRKAGTDVWDEDFTRTEPPAQIDHRPATGPPETTARQREDAGRGHRETAGGIPDPGPIRSAG